MNLWIARQCPPGSSGKSHFQALLVLSYALAFPMLSHFIRAYSQSYRGLFTVIMGQKVLSAGAVMPDFSALHDPILPCLLLYTLVALAFVSFYHASYYRGSRSIYLMRRLPDPWERWRLCLTLPALSLLLFLLILAAILLLSLAFYLLFTPESTLTPGQGQKFWIQNFRDLSHVVERFFAS